MPTPGLVRTARSAWTGETDDTVEMPPRSKQRSLPGLDADVTPAQPAQAEQSTSATVRPKSKTSSAASTKPAPESEPCDDLPQAVDIKGWNVFVVDAYSLIFQVFHALPEMSSPRGEQVAA